MRRLLTLLMCLAMFSSGAMAQSKKITGKIIDEKGNPVPNASVVVKGTKIGTSTLSDGTFELSVPGSGRVLVVSSISFAAQEISIANKSQVSIVLQSTSQGLDEVVVVGYGVQQKKAFTGAAAKINTNEFSNLITASIDKQLSGRAAGVQVTNSSGLVNNPATIRIRGINSINQSNDPLVVVDGVPIISGNLAATTNSNTLGDINPTDIESLEVLKDGSATAIYGSRAAGGVIIITTKKGTRGKAKVLYDGFIGISNPLKTFSVLNAKQFETIANEKLTNAGYAAAAGVNASADTSNTDWQKNVMINNALSQSHTVSVSGGTDKTLYFFSANYSDQKGILISNYNRAFRIRMNLEQEINKFVKVGNTINISRQEDGDQSNSASALGGAIASAIRMLPNVSPYNSANITGYNIDYPVDGLMSVGPNSSTVDDNFYNIAFTIRKDKYYSDKYRIMDNAFIDVSPLKGLKFRSQVGVDWLNDYSYEGLNLYHGDAYGKGDVFNEAQSWLRTVWTNYMNYNLSVKKHNFYLTAGNEFQNQTYKWFSAEGVSISDAFYIKNNIISNAATTQTIGGNYSESGFISYFGRFNYDFNNKYFAQATVRRDGQSSLAPGHKWGSFPGFSIGWRPSQEKYWQNSKFLNTYINEAKIKASYAKVGNTLSGFPYLSTYSNNPYGNISGINPSGVGNPDLKWETSTKYDVGIELGLFKSKFNLAVDWFLNYVDNLVMSVPEPLSAGLSGNTSYDLNGGTISQNIGKLQNNGIEISLGGNIVKTNNLSWDFSANFSAVANKIVSLYSVGGKPVTNISNGNYNIIRNGDPINIIYGYQWAGVNTANGNPMWYKADGSFVQCNLTKSLGTVGAFYVANSKTDGAIGAASSLTTTDKTNLGVSTPTWFGAFSTSFNYKGWGVDVMFRYSGGNKIMNVTRQDALFNMKFQNNGTEILNRWTSAGQVTDVPRLYYGQDNNVNQSNNSNSRFVESGDYVKLQNIVFSYTFPKQFLLNEAKGYISSAKLYIQAQNVYAWTKYKGADPDNHSTLGIDAAVSPQVRTIAIGLSLGF